MISSLFTQASDLIGNYIIDPVVEMYQGSALQSTISAVTDYPLFTTGADQYSEHAGMGKTHSVSSVLKDFAGGFLNIGSTRTGGSGLYKDQPYQAPPVRKISAPKSTAGSVSAATRSADLASQFGFTDAVKGNLAKAAFGDVPIIRQQVVDLIKNGNRRVGTKTKLGTSSLPRVATKTSMPYSRKPKYFG